MAKTTTVGREILKDLLPSDLEEYAERPLDKKTAGELFEKLSRQYPEDYVDLVHNITQFADRVSTEYGRETSLSLKDLRLPKKVEAYREQMKKKVHDITQADMDPEEKNRRIVDYLQGEVGTVKDMIEEEGVKEGNALALSSRYGFRGNKTQLMQMLFGDLLVTDNRGRPIPVPLLHGFVEGLDPLETWAQSYSSRAGYCLDENTPVRMADGSVRRLKEVRVGDWVAGSDLEGNTRPVLVTAVIDQGMQPSWRYVFRPGRQQKNLVEIDCTEQHKALQRLKYGKYWPEKRKPHVAPLGEPRRTMGLVPAKGVDCGNGEHPEAAMLGALLGGGCTTQRVTFTTADEELVDCLNKMYAEMGWYLSEIVRNRASGMPSYEYTVTDSKNGKYEPSDVAAWVRNIGLAGKYSWEKVVPASCFAWNNDDIAMLLSGYTEADGCVTAVSKESDLLGINWSSTAYQLLLDVKELLLARFGVYATLLRGRDRKGQTGKKLNYGYKITARRDSWVLSVGNRTGIEKLQQVLPVLSEKTRRFVEQLSKPVRDEDLVLRYVGREPLGMRHVMDLSVDSPEHLFVLANGVVVSNSAVQFATRDAGYLGKQLEFMGSGLTVTEEDCGTTRGIPMNATDEGAAGRVLNEEVGGFKPGTVLTPAVRKKLGDTEVTLRNPRTCEDEHGICAKCAGVRPNGKFPAIGDYLGGKVTRFLSEPMTQQMGLSAKHLGSGIRGKEDPEDVPGGFPEVNQLLQMPEGSFAGAVHVEEDGLVKDVKKAAQGGNYVQVGDEQYYVPEHLTPQVKKGDRVHAGDPLSSGMQHPGKVAQYKGIGEARKQFVESWTKLVTKHGIQALPQNVDILSRAFIRNVRVTDPDGVGEFRFGEVLPYDVLQKRWTPPEKTEDRALEQAEGSYLQKPVLHYTIGTRLTKPMLADLKKRNIGTVPVTDDEPGFEPYITRAATRSLLDRDWKAGLSGFHLKKSLTESAAMGATDSPEGRKSVHAELWNPGTRGQ